jgi:hypothetical protein
LAAQRRLVGSDFDEYGDSDIEQARSIARAVTGSPAESSELLAHAQEQAGQIIDRSWHQIEALAAELLLHRRLGAEQIVAIIELGPAARRRRHWEQLVARAEASGMTLVAREV